MRKVFISILGKGRYAECKYVTDAYESSPVTFIQEATLDMLCSKGEWTSDDAAYILLTEEAEKVNWLDDGHQDRNSDEPIKSEGLRTRLEKLALPLTVHPVMNLCHGNSETEIWEIFETVFNNLQDGDELYFDLTHGFRYLPMLVLVLINYSKFLKNTTVKSITYGNYEARDKDNRAPIINLLPLSALQDWTFAAGQFLEGGSVDKLVKLSLDKIQPVMARTKGKDDDSQKLRGSILSLNLLVDDMRTCRGQNLLKGTNLAKFRGKMREMEQSFIKPLNPVFDLVGRRFEAFNEEGDFRNFIEAAKWCSENGLYQQAVTILQEGINTMVCAAVEGFDVIDKANRTAVSSMLNLYAPNSKEEDWRTTEGWEGTDDDFRQFVKKMHQTELVQNWAHTYIRCTKLRNDLNHAGMCNPNKKSEELKKKIMKVVESAYEKVVCDKNVAIDESVKEKILVNLSNHSSQSWSTDQLEAASVYGRLVDVPFPAIDESADDVDIQKLAQDFFALLQESYGSSELVVHIMGEQTFTYALVSMLKEAGVTCIASTSKRIVHETAPGVKEVVFKFSRFRNYL